EGKPGEDDAGEAASGANSPSPDPPPSRLDDEDLAPLIDLQERTLRRTKLLELKAGAELERLKTSPPTPPRQRDDDSQTGAPPVDPEQLEAGYQKATELAPRAVEQMNLALKALKQNDRGTAYQPAEEARKILEEIQKSQPPDPQQEQKHQDQKKKDDQ